MILALAALAKQHQIANTYAKNIFLQAEKHKKVEQDSVALSSLAMWLGIVYLSLTVSTEGLSAFISSRQVTKLQYEEQG